MQTNPGAWRLGMGLLAAGALCALAGCGGFGRAITGGSTQLESSIGGGTLGANGNTRVYRVTNAKSAIVYVTDLNEDALRVDADPTGLSGMILQVHVLVTPEAGETPIAAAACNTAVRALVISNGEVGVYSGGAFSYADADDIGEDDFGASVRGGTMRLTHATPGFVDRLVHAKIEGGVSGRLDDAKATQIAARFAWLSAMATPLDSVGYAPELAMFEKAAEEAKEDQPPAKE